MPCEAQGCTEVRPRKECFSFIASIIHMHLENKVYSWYQCPVEQHWCCSHDHAIRAVHSCIHEHHSADKLTRHANLPAQLVSLPEHITHCAIGACDKALTTECYSVPLSYATPGIGYSGYTCADPDPHWCCSEAHAKQAALACLEEHLEEGAHG